MVKRWALLAGAAAVWLVSAADDRLLAGREARLVSVDPMPIADGHACAWSPAYGQSASPQAAPGVERPQLLDQAPVRVIEDEYATFAAVAVDAVRNEIALQDENLFQIRFYNRLANTPPTAAMTEPKRILSGP